jgi:hypothetical protein
MVPPDKRLDISDTCLEQLEAWLLAHCRSAMKDPDFVGGVLYIVNEEVKDAKERGRREAIARMVQPQPQ